MQLSVVNPQAAEAVAVDVKHMEGSGATFLHFLHAEAGKVVAAVHLTEDEARTLFRALAAKFAPAVDKAGLDSAEGAMDPALKAPAPPAPLPPASIETQPAQSEAAPPAAPPAGDPPPAGDSTNT